MQCRLFVFFFKQTTAYDMRISDWSSDVCSSDLRAGRAMAGRAMAEASAPPSPKRRAMPASIMPRCISSRSRGGTARPARMRAPRSEEHTSELQSLMRISYAVFCLKKKNTQKQKQERTIIQPKTKDQNHTDHKIRQKSE